MAKNGRLEPEKEVTAVLETAQSLVNHWPLEWNEYGEDNSMCIMARTYHQVRHSLHCLYTDFPVSMLWEDKTDLRVSSTVHLEDFSKIFRCMFVVYFEKMGAACKFNEFKL